MFIGISDARKTKLQMDGRCDEPDCFSTRYCGEMSSLALTSTTNVLDVMFHSDESFTDKGFSAEYSAYDPSNRELEIVFCTHSSTGFCEAGKLLERDTDSDSLPI